MADADVDLNVESESVADADDNLHRVRIGVVRGMTGEQLYASLRTAAGLPVVHHSTRRERDEDSEHQFISQFFVEQPHSAERSISQSLALMNGAFVSNLTTTAGNPTLASIQNSPFVQPDEQTEILYLAVLGRLPSTAELQAVRECFSGHPETTHEQHLGNLFWALVNSSEFSTNH